MFAFWSRYRWVLVVRGVVAILLGIFALVWALATITTLVLVFGAVALADGILTSVAVIAERRLAADRWVREARRQQADAALREGEERLRRALEAANEGIFDHNIQTGEAHVSAGYATMMGYDPAAFRETTDAWLERMHPDDREPVMAQYLRYLSGEIPEYRVEFRQRTSSGEWRWIQSTGRIVERDASGAPLRMLGTHVDITERRRAAAESEKLQAQLIQSQKMESVGRLAGGVAHDFNNILTTITGYADLLSASLPPGSPLQKELDFIEGDALRAAALTKQLLAFSRKQVLQPQVLSVNAILDEVQIMLKPLIQDDVELRIAPEPQLGLVKADPVQLVQVIMNLAVNARDAMPRGGVLSLTTANREVDEADAAMHPGLKPGSYVLLSVSDTGVGISPEVLPHVFEPFFTTRIDGKGTGLGLATVHGIVQQSGGHIALWSEPGKGTRFDIHLPRSFEERAVQPERKEPGAFKRGTETILFAEDDEGVRRMIVTVLESHGYSVSAAGRPEEALARVTAGQRFDLLVTDIVMPGMGGKELAERVHRALPGIKVLFISGYTDDAFPSGISMQPSTAFLQKPFSPSTLIKAVQTILDR